MDSSYGRLYVVTAAILLQFLLLPANAAARTVFIDAVCQRVIDKPYCLKTLSEYPPAVSASDLTSIGEIVIAIGTSHAEKTMAFADETAKKDPSTKAAFTACHNAYAAVVASFKSATAKLKTTPDAANNDVTVSGDHIRRVRELIGKNGDNASKTLAAMNDQMDKYIDLAAGATDAVDDDDENTYHRA